MVVDENEKNPELTSSAVPPDFLETVRELLEHLYDLPFLQQHSLARHAAITSRQTEETPTQALRKALLAAVESLQPPAGHAVGSQLARIYSVVYLHYVDGMTVHEASHQLRISLRQAYRDLQRGVDSVASVIWERLQTPEALPAPDLPVVHAEVERLQPRLEPTDLALVCANAVRSISPLASQKDVVVEFILPASAVAVSTDRPVAQQILVHVLSSLVQHGQPRSLSVNIEQALNGTTRILADCAGLRQPLGASFIDEVTQQLAAKLLWIIDVLPDDGRGQVVSLTLPSVNRLLLVIDDNEALPDLLDRYLDGTDYRIVAASNPLDGLRLCQELQPEAVLLDVMMPEIDGWELLQRIRNNPTTADIPVIICTVFNDSELAYSLGASRFLPKPVERAQLLAILESLHPHG